MDRHRRDRSYWRTFGWCWTGAVAAIVLSLVLCLATSVSAQRRGRRDRWGYDRRWVELPERDIFPSNCFTFCRVQYSSGRGRGSWGRSGGDWRTDYPDSDINFSIRLTELTTINVNRTPQGEIKHAVVRLTDDDLFNYPFIYMLEVGNLMFSDEEAERLRSYLLRGGFLLVDDFWGDYAWSNWEYEIGQIFSPDQYPVVDIPLKHPIFHCVFEIDEVPQIPAINHFRHWQYTGITYEPGHDYRYTGDTNPHCRGIFDKKGRLMIVMMHNTDLGDGWEREGENEGYFREFSVKKAYPMGINIVVYAMTHSRDWKQSVRDRVDTTER
jgi:hypothetical protein